MEKFESEPTLNDNDPLFDACRTGNSALVIEFLESGGSAFANSENRPHLASFALQGGHLPILEAMVRADLDVNDSMNRFGERPISYSARCGHFHVISFLLERGADVNATTTSGISMFCRACADAPLEVVKILFEAGGNIHHQCDAGRTPFRFACQSSQFETMEFLLSKGANINEPDSNKATPLIGCAMGGKLQGVLWLLDHGADMCAKDDRGKSALDWATENGHVKVAEVIQQRLGQQ